MTQQPSLLNLARDVLCAGDPDAKIAAAQALNAAWASGVTLGDAVIPNDQPPRLPKPVLVPPSELPRRRLGSVHGRAALLHAVAHIEFNAIDLAADMLARFAYDPLLAPEHRRDFARDWISVCDDEARHFAMVRNRLTELGMSYGDLPAHNGLWDAALATKDNFAARLAIAPMVLEARGLDVTPAMIEKLDSAGDSDSADVLRVIYSEEIRHVAIGRHWFGVVSESCSEDDVEFFRHLVKKYFKGPLKPPFNIAARDKAQLPREFYLNYPTHT